MPQRRPVDALPSGRCAYQSSRQRIWNRDLPVTIAVGERALMDDLRSGVLINPPWHQLIVFGDLHEVR
jgi:hypothetical protein